MVVIDVIEDRLAVPVVSSRACAQATVVEIHRPVGADQGESVGAETAEGVVLFQVLLEQRARHMHRLKAPADDLIDVLQQRVALGKSEILVHPARHRAGAMYPFAGGMADHFLAVFAQQHALARHLGIGGGDANDIAFGHLGVETEQEIGRGQMEKMQRVRLQYLAVVHQPAQFLRGGGELVRADDLIERLGRGKMVRYRADAAQPLHHHRHFPIRPALDELLETTEFHDVQARLLDVILFIQQQGDLAVAFNARDRVDGDAAQAFRVGCGFKVHEQLLLENARSLHQVRLKRHLGRVAPASSRRL